MPEDMNILCLNSNRKTIFFSPVQDFDLVDDNAEHSDISSASEDEESNKTLLD